MTDHKPVTPERIAEIRERNAARTQGRWALEREELRGDDSDEEQGTAFFTQIGPWYIEGHVALGTAGMGDRDDERIEADAAFMEHAGDDITDLLADNDKLRISAPIDMVLHCPACGTQHVDAPEPERGWNNPPHRSHLCHGCGCIWRPAAVSTNGVAALDAVGSGDTWTPADQDSARWRLDRLRAEVSQHKLVLVKMRTLREGVARVSHEAQWTTAEVLVEIDWLIKDVGAKSPVEQRADEIEAAKPWTAREAIAKALAIVDAGVRSDAAAWLVVAQRMLAREAAR